MLNKLKRIGINRLNRPYRVANSLLSNFGLLLDKRSVSLSAFYLFQKGRSDSAYRLFDKYVPQESEALGSVLKLTQELKDDDWVRNLNHYLGKYSGSQLTLLDRDGSRFSRISAKKKESTSTQTLPLVSVIMPVFNAENTLVQSANSILHQSLKNVELIMVDDCSTDRSYKIMQSMAKSDSRIKIIQTPVNSGPYVAKNMALNIANGTFITGQDADDFSLPERLENHMRFMEENNLAVSYSYMVRMDETGIVSKIRWRSRSSMDGFSHLSSISTIFRDDFIRNRLGYWDDVRYGADSEMIERARIAAGKDFGIFKSIGMLCLSHAGSLTNHPITGISENIGRSPIRKAYHNHWLEWHGCLAKGAPAYLPFPHDPRQFSAPEEMMG